MKPESIYFGGFEKISSDAGRLANGVDRMLGTTKIGRGNPECVVCHGKGVADVSSRSDIAEAICRLCFPSGVFTK